MHDSNNNHNHGGKRKGAGRPRGSKARTTIQKLLQQLPDDTPIDVLDAENFTRLAQHHAGHALAVLRAIAEDPKAPGHSRVQAAKALIEYGFGKPRVAGPAGAWDKDSKAPATVPVLPAGASIPLDYPWLLANDPEEANRLHAEHVATQEGGVVPKGAH